MFFVFQAFPEGFYEILRKKTEEKGREKKRWGKEEFLRAVLAKGGILC